MGSVLYRVRVIDSSACSVIYSLQQGLGMSKTPFFVKIARPTYGRYLRTRYRITTKAFELLTNLDGPFLVLSNHAHILDPFFISAVFPVHIRWVAGAYLFKNPILKTLLTHLVGTIPKQQGRNDFTMFRMISDAFKTGDVVGLFPEGTRTWDGEPVGFDKATAKLVRLFHVPVVLVNLEGGYALKPRWARFSRSGSLTIRIVRILMPQEIASLRVEELDSVLEEGLGFSTIQWQQRVQLPFFSSRRAKGLEQVLYLCPSCDSLSTIVTKNNEIRCTNCSFHLTLDPYDNLRSSDGPPVIRSIHGWHEWERGKLANIARSAKEGESIFPPDNGILLQKGFGDSLLTISKSFLVWMERSGIVVQLKKQCRTHLHTCFETFSLPFSGMQSMIINAKGTLELYCNGELWRIRIKHDKSILKYLELFTAFRTVAIAGEGGSV